MITCSLGVPIPGYTGVDLTAYLTQGRADRVIELRGGNGPTHLHLDGVAEEW